MRWQRATPAGRLRIIAAWASGGWILAAALGLGFFSGGTTSLPFALVLLYGTGTALLVLVALGWARLRESAARRLDAGSPVLAAPEVPAVSDGSAPATQEQAARSFLAITDAARQEFLAALLPVGATGTPEVLKATAPSRSASAAGPRSDLAACPAAAGGSPEGRRPKQVPEQAPAAKVPADPASARTSGAGPKSAISKKARRKTPARPTRADLVRAA